MNPFAKTLTANPAIARRISEIQGLAAKVELHMLENADALDPAGTISRLTAEMGRAEDPAEAHQAMEQIAKLSLPQAADLARVLANQAQALYEPLKAATIALCDEAEALLLESRRQAERAEQGFFASLGLATESTSATRQFDRPLSEVRAIKSALQGERLPGSALPVPSNNPALRWFGVSLA